MSANFVHGVETIELKKGPVPIRVVKSAVIGLVGSAPKGPFQALTVVNNAVEAAQFGQQIDGFTIPQALEAIFKQGAGSVLVVNVADTTSNTYTSAVTDEEVEVENRAAKTEFAPFGTIVVTSDGGGTATPETRATATYTVTTGAASGNTLTLTTNAVALFNYTAGASRSTTQLAGDIADSINAGTVTHGYTATASGAVVTITAPTGSGASVNGNSITATATGTIAGTSTNFSGGVTAVDDDIVYTAGTDYTIDELGNITILASTSTIEEGATLKVTYRKFNSASINSSRLIGTIDGGTGVKTGMKLFKDAYNMYGFKPKILITPGYSSLNSVATEMIAVANEHKAIALLDAPVGTTVAGAITGRGPLGSINFNTSSERAFLLYPHWNVYNPVKDANELQPYSQFMAGVIASTDLRRGYWKSPSNEEILGVQGPERVISFAINDASTQANQLNEAGITCYASSFGTGFRTWGNRTAAWPTNTNVKNFLVIRRIADIVHESIELAMIQFVDEPLDPANRVTIDAILDSVNNFIRTLIGRGALLQNSRCEFDPAKNPADVLAAGQIVFDLVFMGPTPAERITFESFVDQSLLTPPQTA